MSHLILKGGRIITGTGAEPILGMAVVIEGSEIVGLTDDGQVKRGQATILDLSGLTILPGLINCHTHLCLGGEADPIRRLAGESPFLTTLRAAAHARATVEAGVTTIRDMGGREYVDLAIKRAVEERLIMGPRMLVAGKPVMMTGGHGHWMGREADGPDEVRKAVREQLKAGVDLIKLIATGGVMTPGVEPGSPQLSLEELRAAVEEAVKAGRRTAAHAQGSQGIAHAIAAGIDTIEHGISLTEEIVARMLEREVTLVPTLIAPNRIATEGIAAGIPEFMVRKSQAVTGNHIQSFQLAHKSGVPIACGTDAGTPLNPHGSVVPELELMVKYGMTPLEAIRSATALAAQAIGLGELVGRVAPGLRADLVAVEGNPAGDVRDLERVKLVLVDGIIVRNDLGERRTS